MVRDPARAGLAGPLPPARTPVGRAPLLAIDLEMTGLDPAHDEIISIAWVPLRHGAIALAEAEEVHLRPSRPISVGHSATIHGIRDCDRGDGLAPAEGLARLLAALSGHIAVFHHAPLDTAFLDRALRATGQTGWRQPSIDTLAWFRQRQLRRGNESPPGASTLDAARRHYGLPERSAHNALDDALSCAELALVLAARSRARLIDVCSVPGGRF
jgi:DNA polymerase-3 subunit epsilon